MPLATLGGKLLVAAGKLAASAACCCARWCRQTGRDACGNPVYECSAEPAGSIGACTPECKPSAEPCECGPDVPCPECKQCVDRACVRVENCCADGTPCPPCFKCDGNVCVPCGACEICVDGVCQPCGPCQKCVDDECVPCGANEVCVDGVCVPKQYYCCWDSCEDKLLAMPNTTCLEAVPFGGALVSPCGAGQQDGYGTCDLTKSGPYASLQQCQPACHAYRCVPDACGFNQCVPDPNGPYGNLGACLEACPSDPCAAPCTFIGAALPGVYSIDACERTICVSFISTNSRPIRVQIWGPTLDQNCNVIASRVIKADSGWRADECCDCPNARNGGALQGGPKGQIIWNKPRGVQSFEVAVLTACGPTYQISIQCSGECPDLGNPAMCACDVDGDCNPPCVCVTQPDGSKKCGPPLCPPCPAGDCAWPADRQEFGLPCGGNPCCDPPEMMGNASSRYQWISDNLPFGVTWKDGFPAALAGCNFKWVTDISTGLCFIGADNACTSESQCRHRLMVINCDTQSVEDITGTAAQGLLTQVSQFAPPAFTCGNVRSDSNCTDGPSYPPYFPDPVPICPP